MLMVLDDLRANHAITKVVPSYVDQYIKKGFLCHESKAQRIIDHFKIKKHASKILVVLESTFVERDDPREFKPSG